jgi:hypothetical protein
MERNLSIMKYFGKIKNIATGNNETGGAGISLAISLPAEMKR